MAQKFIGTRLPSSAERTPPSRAALNSQILADSISQLAAPIAKKAGVAAPRVTIDENVLFAKTSGGRRSWKLECSPDIALLADNEIVGMIGHETAHQKFGHLFQRLVARSGTALLTALTLIQTSITGEGGSLNWLAALGAGAAAGTASVLFCRCLERIQEFRADKEGARLVGTAKGIVAAIQKTAHEKRESVIARLFSPHPAAEERIAMLEA